MKEIKVAHHENQKSNKKAHHELAKKRHAALKSSPVDESSVRSISLEMAENSATAMIQGASMHGQILAVLTDEQRAQLAEMKAKHVAKREEKRAKRKAKMEARKAKKAQKG